MENVTSSLARQQWLEAAVAALRGKFSAAGYTVPDKVRVSVGFPKGGGRGAKTSGQCWARECSTDGHGEIFISPELDDGARIFDALAHELAHDTVGVDKGHKKPFKTCALAIGLTGKMTATVATPEFGVWAASQIERIGKYPAGAMDPKMRKKQSTRLLKCYCETCDYVARVSKKWVEQAGTPVCPTDSVEMACDAVDPDDDDGE